MKLIRLLDDIASDLEHQTQAIRVAATAASEVEDSAEEMGAAVHARLVALSKYCQSLARQLEHLNYG